MSIPSRAEAARILRAMEPPDWLLTHSTVVADIAAYLTAAIRKKGHAIDTALVDAAGLLHDIDKAFPADHPLKWLGHGEAGAEWARQNGHAEIATALANHPVMRLADDEHWSAWHRGATVEERVVAYADKRATQDLVSLAERFDRWAKRHGENVSLQVARGRAEQLERDVCGAAGVVPTDVRRERWAAAALERAESEVGPDARK